MKNVRVNNLVLWAEPGPQELSRFKGFAIGPAGFDGFLDGVDVRRETVAHEQSPGDFDLPGTLTARTTPLSGWCRADDFSELLHFRSQLTGLLALEDSATVVADFGSELLWGRAKPALRPSFKVRAKTPRIADWQLHLWFPDPRLFGETRTFPAGTPAYHYGNFAATPVHTITGVGSGYTINGPGGKTFTVTTAVTAGSPHTIDMATGFLSIGGVRVIGGVTSGDVWAIPGGAQVTHTLTGSGLTLSTALTDTFI